MIAFAALRRLRRGLPADDPLAAAPFGRAPLGVGRG
jgi:hypothetical protein